MKKIIITGLMAVGVFFTSCELDGLNEDSKRPATADPVTLFSNAQLSLAHAMASPSVNLNIFRLIMQYWNEVQYMNEARYDISNRGINDAFWHTLNRDVIADLVESRRLIEANTELDAAEKENQLAMIDVLEVYTWSVLITTFGDVPYREAMDINRIQPAYDDAYQIYGLLLERLDAAIATLNANRGVVVFETADVLYGGNVGQWIKFSNSLKMRLGMMMADANSAQAKSIVEAAAPHAFTSDADNAAFAFSTVPPNTNPLWTNLIQSGRRDFVAATTMIAALDTIGDPADVLDDDVYDPRLPVYFDTTLAAEGVAYVGGFPGQRSTPFTNYSLPGKALTLQNLEAVLLDYTEVKFYMAEAAARGWAVAGTAEDNYYEAITSSMRYWDVEEAAIQSYLQDEDVQYTGSGWDAEAQRKIGIQSWLAFYNRGYTSWLQWRRLDYPKLEEAAGAISGIPVRYFYPVSEQNVNKANYEAAVARASLGGDDSVESRLFFDVADQ
ncbi:SusD/RagB family nutrient-binding outer membrane lipoprotein [Cesiribacter sp. SM1]|uniref:SusD/RagB family nutrient-binding outer membrane lipoprotein n=1 Tax=Cesiribacter sp. SM1 TaxID=2861196 RepID=UPI001CD601C9|nr:SusD/RagB family nutrient-binding outer membrane lipoprotein [Cesiribacter sp. SM1]